MKQQFSGLRHCKSGMGWKRDIGFFERTLDMLFGLRRNAPGRPWICCRVWRWSWGACKDKAEIEGRRRLPSGGAGARRATERGLLSLRFLSEPLSVIATRCHLSPRRGFSVTSCTIQNLQSYGLCGILDIEKDNRPQRWVAELVKKNPLRARQSQGAVFLCP